MTDFSKKIGRRTPKPDSAFTQKAEQARVRAKNKTVSNAVKTQREINKGEILVAGTSAGGSTYTTRILKAIGQRTDPSRVIRVSVTEGSHQEQVFEAVERAVAQMQKAFNNMGCTLPLNIDVRMD